jgi:hypothetical protein
VAKFEKSWGGDEQARKVVQPPYYRPRQRLPRTCCGRRRDDSFKAMKIYSVFIYV